jgi:hypothetical protein
MNFSSFFVTRIHTIEQEFYFLVFFGGLFVIANILFLTPKIISYSVAWKKIMKKVPMRLYMFAVLGLLLSFARLSGTLILSNYFSLSLVFTFFFVWLFSFIKHAKKYHAYDEKFQNTLEKKQEKIKSLRKKKSKRK